MGRFAVVAAGKAGLYVIDIEDDSGVHVVGHLGNLGFLRDVAVAGDYVFAAADKDGLLQVSIETPSAPRLVGEVELPLSLQVFARTLSVAVKDDKMMVANARAGCQIFDISKPEKPRFITSIASMVYVRGVNAFEDSGYLYDFENGIQAFDLKALQRVRSIDSSKLTGLAVVGGKRFLVTGMVVFPLCRCLLNFRRLIFVVARSFRLLCQPLSCREGIRFG